MPCHLAGANRHRPRHWFAKLHSCDEARVSTFWDKEGPGTECARGRRQMLGMVFWHLTVASNPMPTMVSAAIPEAAIA